MYRGYVKLWRKSLDAGVFDNPITWKFWCWCLMKASHKEYDAVVGYQTVHLMPGDFIFGRSKASADLRQSERSIRTCLHFLEKSQNVTIKATNKYSIISIVNWKTYQSDEILIDQQNDQPVTNKRPANDQQVTTYKNEKNEKNEKNKKNKTIEGPVGVTKETWDAFIEMRKSMKAPLTTFSAKLIIAKLVKLTNDNGNGMELILQQSITNGWKGPYPLKDGNYGSDRKVIEQSGMAKSDGESYPVDAEC
jgi:hypothetical protein